MIIFLINSQNSDHICNFILLVDTVPLDVATESYWSILDRRQETTRSEMGHGNGFATHEDFETIKQY